MGIIKNAIANHQRAKLIRKVDREIDNPTEGSDGRGGRRRQGAGRADRFQSSRASRMGFGRCARREDGQLEACRLNVRDERWQAGGYAKDVVRPLSPDEAKAIVPQIQRAMDQGHGELNPDCGVDLDACGQFRDALTACANDKSPIRISARWVAWSYWDCLQR